MGTCQVFNSPNGKPDPPLTAAGLDAGPQITVKGPNGSKTASGSGGDYRTTLSSTGNFFSPETIAVSAPGEADVPSFSTSINLPALPTMTSPPPDSASPTPVTRSNGLTVTWSGGSPNGYIQLNGFSYTDNTGASGVTFQCSVPAGSGTFTIPPSVLMTGPSRLRNCSLRLHAHRRWRDGSGAEGEEVFATPGRNRASCCCHSEGRGPKLHGTGS